MDRTITIHVKVEAAMKRELSHVARQEHLELSDIVRRALRNYLASLPQPEKGQVAP